MTAEIREAFARMRSNVEALRSAGAPPDDIVEAHSREVDEVVCGLFEAALARSGNPGSGVALVALGGYGRRELAPASDLDLLLLYRGWSSSEVTSLNREIRYPLWDSGRELGDRVREPRDVVRSFERVDEVCALIDARFLAGDRGLFSDLDGSVRRRLERGRASFFKDLVQSSTDRHLRYGHAGHLLEPNIRDSAGGLRDIHTLLWASKVLPGGEGLGGLVASGQLSRLDADLIAAARSFLLRLRIGLHLLTSRHQDQLYLAEQDDLAKGLGYEGNGAGPADRIMQELYQHARQVDAVVHSFWDRVTHRRRRRWRSSSSEALTGGCAVIDGRIEVIAATHPRDDPAGWLRVFLTSVRLGLPIGRGSLNRLQEELAQTPEVAWSPEARDVFLDILQSGSNGVRALEAMDSAGFLGALIPTWEPIRCFPQRDLYHRFTVDRHLFAAVAELATSRSADEPDLKEAWSRVEDHRSLFVATLLHDIGKGRGGDHSELGTALTAETMERMGFDAARVATAEFLVREHLTLISLATRRDLNDPRTIDEMVERVGDVRRLSMLFLLTRADSLATGPEAWSSFRASLVRELYARTKQRLEGAPAAPAEMSQRLSELAVALDLPREQAERLVGPMPEAWLVGLDPDSARRQIDLLREPVAPGEVRTSAERLDEADELIVVAPDRPGLFATVAGVLALRGIDVHDAEIYTRSDNVAIEIFRVRGANGAVPEDRWEQVQRDIAGALEGRLDLDDALGRKAAQTRRRRAGGRHRAPMQVVVDNNASETHTVVEVHTEDRLGLLRLITKALVDAGCDLSFAKIATFGVDVVDVFYVHDLEGHRVMDPEHVRRIEESLHRALQPGEAAQSR
ncbi:MAG: [protein-PII] uridylyltransferase [Actinomycetota bacterium]